MCVRNVTACEEVGLGGFWPPWVVVAVSSFPEDTEKAMTCCCSHRARDLRCLSIWHDLDCTVLVGA